MSPKLCSKEEIQSSVYMTERVLGTLQINTYVTDANGQFTQKSLFKTYKISTIYANHTIC